MFQFAQLKRRMSCLIIGAGLMACSVVAQNLVSNPSFELADTCHSLLGFTDEYHPSSWMAFRPSPDHMMGCQAEGWVTDVPNNIFTYQHAMDGMAYCGMWSFVAPFVDDHEKVGIRLTEPLVIGDTYYASMYVNAAYGGSEAPGLAIDHFGMLFSVDSFDIVGGDPHFALRNYAQVYSGTVISDTAQWTFVSGSFVADSAYRFLVIGNHFSDVLTDTVRIGPGYPWAYVLVDDVCVSRDPDCLSSGLGSSYALDDLTMWVDQNAQQLVIQNSSSELSVMRILDGMGRLVSMIQLSGTRQVIPVTEWSTGPYIALASGARDHVLKFIVLR